jgi:hypothetical protein
MPSIGQNLQSETNFRMGSALTTIAWQKRMKEVFKITCETKMVRIYDNQDSKRCTWSEQWMHQSSYAATNRLEMNMVALVSKKV